MIIILIIFMGKMQKYDVERTAKRVLSKLLFP